MDSYSPRITDYLLPFLMFIIGEWTFHTSWSRLGTASYSLGGISVIVITYALLCEIRRMNFQNDNTATKVSDAPRSMPDRAEPSQVHVSVTEDRTTKMFNLPATPSQLEKLATALIERGDSFSQRRWTGRGQPFSIASFNALRDEMTKRGMLYQINEKDPRQGYGLTRFGVNVMKRFINVPHSPTVSDLQPLTGDM